MSDFEHGGIGTDNITSLKSDDHLTAFGLALMHNGFPTPNSILSSQTFQQINKQNQTNFLSSTGSGSSAHASSEIDSQKETTQHTNNELNAWNSKSENYHHSQKQYK